MANKKIQLKTTSGDILFPYQRPGDLTSYTTAEVLTAALTAGTIVPKSGTLAVKIRRLVVHKSEYETAASLLANASTAELDLVGTGDGRLINMAANGSQPILSTLA